jgi:nicotinamide riboside transporter PnuC
MNRHFRFVFGVILLAFIGALIFYRPLTAFLMHHPWLDAIAAALSLLAYAYRVYMGERHVLS